MDKPNPTQNSGKENTQPETSDRLEHPVKSAVEKLEKKEQMECVEVKKQPAVQPEYFNTDILLGHIHLTQRSETSVSHSYHFTFLKSRPVLFIGRDKEKCGEYSIIIEDETISPCHASIRWKDGKLVLQDEGSISGTFLDGRRLVSYTSAPLPDHCHIGIGKVVLRYHCGFPEGMLEGNSNSQTPADSSLETKETYTDEGFVIAEFTLLSLDAPCALPHHCEIMSNKSQFLIGRASHCDYQVEFKDKYVADEQAVIIYSAQEQTFAIKGLVKENPIFVNNQRLKDIHRLKSGDIIRLGVASNAPKVRFSIESEEEVGKETLQLSQTIESLERGKIYTIGNTSDCSIKIQDPGISEIVVEMKVPERGDHLLVTRVGHSDIKIAVDGSELKEKETRALLMHQTMQIGSFFSLVHDQSNFIAPRSPQNLLFSEIVPIPKRGESYCIGRADHCAFKIADPRAPYLIAEIFVPFEGEYFQVKKLSESNISVTIDGQPINEGPRTENRYGVNQVLSIGDYLCIRNNHRTLPPPVVPFPWRKFLKSILFCVCFSLLALGIGMVVKKYWNQLNLLISTQKRMKEYQKNVFYIAVFDKAGKSVSSGTGFLLPQKDMYEKDIYYLVTCKHVIQPWKIENHQEKAVKLYNEAGEEIANLEPTGGNYLLAVWPYNTSAIDPVHQNYLLNNSFNNSPGEEKLGDVEIYRLGQDAYEKVEPFRSHLKKSSEDLAILKLKPKNPKWQYSYYPWSVTEKKQLDVGEPVIVLGYTMGGGRLLNKSGIAIPASCEGKLTSDCQSTDFLEIDVNQTHGASGGPVVDNKGKVVGVVSFSDKEKKLVYAIHGHTILKLLK